MNPKAGKAKGVDGTTSGNAKGTRPTTADGNLPVGGNAMMLMMKTLIGALLNSKIKDDDEENTTGVSAP